MHWKWFCMFPLKSHFWLLCIPPKCNNLTTSFKPRAIVRAIIPTPPSDHPNSYSREKQFLARRVHALHQCHRYAHLVFCSFSVGLMTREKQLYKTTNSLPGLSVKWVLLSKWPLPTRWKFFCRSSSTFLAHLSFFNLKISPFSFSFAASKFSFHLKYKSSRKIKISKISKFHDFKKGSHVLRKEVKKPMFYSFLKMSSRVP